jgi:hypothetical protein
VRRGVVSRQPHTEKQREYAQPAAETLKSAAKPTRHRYAALVAHDAPVFALRLLPVKAIAPAAHG